MRERIKQQTGVDDASSISVSSRCARTRQPQQQRQKRGINENYARELMELHTLGVDGGYTQTDIVEVAKCFTGWTIADPRGYRQAAAGDDQGNERPAIEQLQRQAGVPDDIESGEFYFNAAWHEGGTKTVLGQKIDEGGVKDGLKVIDILVQQSADCEIYREEAGRQIRQRQPERRSRAACCRRFHSSNGDIKTTLRALFTDKEFFAPENYRAKIKSPFELADQLDPAVGGDTNGGPAMLAMLNKLGEVPYGYQAPTGYPDKAEDWVNTGALLERLNFAIAIASNRIPGTRVNLKDFDGKDKKKTLEQAISEIPRRRHFREHSSDASQTDRAASAGC